MTKQSSTLSNRANRQNSQRPLQTKRSAPRRDKNLRGEKRKAFRLTTKKEAICSQSHVRASAKSGLPVGPPNDFSFLTCAAWRLANGSFAADWARAAAASAARILASRSMMGSDSGRVLKQSKQLPMDARLACQVETLVSRRGEVQPRGAHSNLMLRSAQPSEREDARPEETERRSFWARRKPKLEVDLNWQDTSAAAHPSRLHGAEAE